MLTRRLPSVPALTMAGHDDQTGTMLAPGMLDDIDRYTNLYHS
jgi:hypothetical protein